MKMRTIVAAAEIYADQDMQSCTALPSERLFLSRKKSLFEEKLSDLIDLVVSGEKKAFEKTDAGYSEANADHPLMEGLRKWRKGDCYKEEAIVSRNGYSATEWGEGFSKTRIVKRPINDKWKSELFVDISQKEESKNTSESTAFLVLGALLDFLIEECGHKTQSSLVEKIESRKGKAGLSKRSINGVFAEANREFKRES